MRQMNQEESWLLQEKYDGAESEAFRADVKLLQTGMPLAYLIGHIPFLNVTIHLDSKPLIPRTETEYWVEKAIGEIKKSHISNPHVLDLCAGSGCIGVSILKEVPRAVVHFAEIEKKHHATILKNISENNLAHSRAAIFDGDLFEHINGGYNFILSNPPYIPNQSPKVAQSVKDNEPHRALYSGDDGLYLITRIITEAKKHLTQDGILFIEHEPEQEEAVQALAQQALYTVTTHTDLYNVPRYSRLCVAK